jgi:hypothetical protein
MKRTTAEIVKELRLVIKEWQSAWQYNGPNLATAITAKRIDRLLSELEGAA